MVGREKRFSWPLFLWKGESNLETVVGEVKKHRITKVLSRTDSSSCKCPAVREWYILPRFLAIVFTEKKKLWCLFFTLQNVIGYGTVAGRLSRLCGVLWLRWLSSDNHLFSIIGSKGGAVLSPVWPGHKSWRWRQMWVEFVVGSLSPCSARFLFRYNVLRFSPLLKNQHFQINGNTTRWP